MAKKKESKKKIRQFYAEEVCYGLSIAMHVGMPIKEALEYVSEDFDKWADLVTWHGQTWDGSERVDD